MQHHVIVSFGKDKEFEYKFAGGVAQDDARKWFSHEFEVLECDVATPTGKILAVDRILCVAKYAGESRFRDQGGDEYVHRVQEAIGPVAAQQVEMKAATNQPFDSGRHRAGGCRKAAKRVTMQAARQSDGHADCWSAEDAAEDRADGARIGDGTLDLVAEVGSHNAKRRKNGVTDEFAGKSHRQLDQR